MVAFGVKKAIETAKQLNETVRALVWQFTYIRSSPSFLLSHMGKGYPSDKKP